MPDESKSNGVTRPPTTLSVVGKTYHVIVFILHVFK